MRSFALIISEGMSAGIGLSTLLLNKDVDEVEVKNDSLILKQNCFGANDSIAIDFDLQFTNDKQMPYKTITLYNVNRYWLGMFGNTKLKGKKITLYAGTKLTPTLTRQNVYNSNTKSCYIINDFQMLESPIFDGYIDNTYIEMENGTTSLTITVGSAVVENNNKFSLSSVISSPLKIPSGTVWFPIVKSWIVKSYLKKLALPPIIKKGKITQTTSKADIDIDNIKSIKANDTSLSLQNILSKNFGCDIVISASGTIIIQDTEGEKEEDAESLKNTLLNNNIISDNDLLTQPSLVDVSKDQRIMITLPLTNRFNFEKNSSFTLITKSATIFNHTLTQGDTVERFNFSSKLELGKYWYGTYNIVQIWHTGASRNSDINAWVTKIEGVKTTDIKLNIEEALKKIYKKSWLS